MRRSNAALQYEKACALLPERLSLVALDIERERMAEVEEIRLRIGRPLSLTLPCGELPLPRTRVIRDDLENVIDRATEFSRYTSADTLCHGFVTAEGGFRVGVCATILSEGGISREIRDISSLSIRIPRMVDTLAHPVLGKLILEGRLVSTLILSPPGGGKTTFLRDLVRIVSDGSELLAPMRVSLVDERGEIAAMYRGCPQLAVGQHTDVMDGCPKSLAVPMLMRSMTPEVIAVDEVAVSEDVRALTAAANCGAVLLATAHCGSTEELRERTVLRDLVESGVFKRTVIVKNREGKRFYSVEEL